MTLSNYKTKAEELNAKYPKTNAKAVTGWGGQLQIEVSTVDQAKALKKTNREYTFKSGFYIA